MVLEQLLMEGRQALAGAPTEEVLQAPTWAISIDFSLQEAKIRITTRERPSVQRRESQAMEQMAADQTFRKNLIIINM